MSEYHEFEAILRDKLRTLTQQDQDTAETRKPVELDQQAIGRLSRMDAMQQQAMAKATSNLRAVEITKITAALERLKEGEYGYCLDCGEDIPKPRLHQDPAVQLCIECIRG